MGYRVLSNKDLLGLRIETTPYLHETLSSSDFDQSIYNIQVTPLSEMFKLKHATGDFGIFRHISGKELCNVKFSVDIYSLPIVTDAPKYFEILQACGWKQETHGTTGISIRPYADYGRTPATIWALYNQESDDGSYKQIAYKISGAMGKVDIVNDDTGKPLRIDFDFTGAMQNIETIQEADAITPATFDISDPVAFLNATVQYGNQFLYTKSFAIHSNEIVTPFTGIDRRYGVEGSRVVDRMIMGEFDLVEWYE